MMFSSAAMKVATRRPSALPLIFSSCSRGSNLLALPVSAATSLSTILNGSRNVVTTTKFNLPDYTQRTRPSLTKIVATIGPTSEQEGPLQQVTDAGMNIMRLNFSHATKEEVELRVANLQKATQTLYQNQQVVGILLDTKGPEIRTGKLRNDTTGHDTITLQQGSKITLRTDDASRDAGSTETDLYIDFPYLSQVLTIGSNVLLDDGACTVTVDSTSNTTNGTLTCTIRNTATLRSRAGVNIPDADTTQFALPALSDKDKADILYGMSASVDIDYVAASFVQSGQGVRDIRNYIEQCAQQLKYTTDQPRPLIISKIETASSLKHFDEILYESDAIMVARGDVST
jgi:pyruvate kinase